MAPCTCEVGMTYLELVNEVLKRLREPTVTDVNGNKYTKLIAALVNDAKRAVEDAAPWVAMMNTVSITTTSGTSDYSVTDTNNRTTINDVVEDNLRYVLSRESARKLIVWKQKETTNNRPMYWAVVGTDSSDQLSLRFYPTPDGARDYSVNCVIPEGDLVDNTDTITCPSEPVFMRAFAYAIKERGEDNGMAYREAIDEYKRVLSRYLILNNSAAGGSGSWQVL